MKLHIDVVQEDIDQGCASDGGGSKGGGCMVYRAFDRSTEGALPGFEVGYRNLYWKAAVLARLPLHVQSLIRDFDQGRPVTPFGFDLELSDEVLQGTQI